MFTILIEALRETCTMILLSSILAAIMGVPLGIFITIIAHKNNITLKLLHKFFNLTLWTITSTPYVLIILLFVPATNILLRHEFNSSQAAIIPLAIAGSAMLSYQTYKILINATTNIKEITVLTNSSYITIIKYMLAENLSAIILKFTNVLLLLLGWSIIAGAFGAGGLGSLAIQKTLTANEPKYLFSIILALILLNQFINYTGKLIAELATKR